MLSKLLSTRCVVITILMLTTITTKIHCVRITPAATGNEVNVEQNTKATLAHTSSKDVSGNTLQPTTTTKTATAAAAAKSSLEATRTSILWPHSSGVGNRRRYETTKQITTTSLLPLQPPPPLSPLNMTSTTTSIFPHNQQWQHQQQHGDEQQTKYSISDNVAVSGDSALSALPFGQRQSPQHERQQTTNGRHFVYGYFIGRANDSAFQQHNEMQQQEPLTGSNKHTGSYQVQLPAAEARTHVHYTADETGYHPVVRYESKNNTTMVSSHFALGQSTVLPLESHVNSAPKLPNNTHGYLHFEFNYDDAAERRSSASEDTDIPNGTYVPIVTADGKQQQQPTNGNGHPQSQQNTVTVNEVLSNLFPNGFADIFRFSYASDGKVVDEGEGVATTTTTTLGTETTISGDDTIVDATTDEAGHDALFPTTYSPQSTGSVVLGMRPSQNKTEYSIATSMSSEYRRKLGPGRSEIVVEQIVLPTAVKEEYNEANNFITKDDLLRINRAASEASVLPSMLIEPNRIAVANDTTRAGSVPIVILNGDDGSDVEDMPAEDNQIAESQNVGQEVYQRLPDHIKVQSFRETSMAGEFGTNANAQNQQINVQIIHDETLANSVKADATEADNKQKSVATHGKPREERASRELDSFQEIAERHFHQQNTVHEAPSRKFLKNFNPVLSQSVSPGTLPPKSTFHYESRQQLQPRTSNGGSYDENYVPPAAQLQYQINLQQQQHEIKSYEPIKEGHDSTARPIYHSTSTVTPNDIVFVTLSTPAPKYEHASSTLSTFPKAQFQKSIEIHSHSQSDSLEQPSAKSNTKTPHEFVSEAAAEASHIEAQKTTKPKPYTFVEVQKSINIHNKLITEKDGRLLEEHETIYHQPQYVQNIKSLNVENKPNLSPNTLSPHEYVSLSANPIRVQQLDNEAEQQEVASHSTEQHISPTLPASSGAHQNYVNFDQQPYALPLEKTTEEALHSITHDENAKYVHSYPEKEIVEKIVDRPVEVPYPVPIERYIDRPYPVHEIIETHVPVPYPVPKPVPIAVPFDRYIDRPVPVETIVEKPVPYPVEKVVEKVVEKQVPVEVERIVEKPVEKVVNKVVDRPIPVPIHVPVAVPVPVHSHTNFGISGPGLHSHYPPTLQGHPNAIPWPMHTRTPIPQKVMQNYYTRMLKKLLPQMTSAYRGISASSTPTRSPTATKTAANPVKANQQPIHPIQHAYRILDMRFDLKPPPPPQLGPNWSTSTRYIYNTLPQDLTAASALATPIHAGSGDPSASGHTTGPHEVYDEFQRWRNGHSLKRSPDFGRNLQMEYGFKPPLVPSVEIDDKGMPLKAVVKSDD